MFLTTLKRTLAAGSAVILLSGSAVGLASAQGTPMSGFERGVALGVAAQAIGITPQQLRSELPGKSLAEVAQAHGKNPADVALALKNAANQRIDQEVTEGTLTVDQADQRKQTVDQRIDQAVNRVVPQAQSGQGWPSPTVATPVPAT
jgi:hypothetical protein